jgi:exopolysaccharide biosynthesis WecB/TagA/CpsF family protein
MKHQTDHPFDSPVPPHPSVRLVGFEFMPLTLEQAYHKVMTQADAQRPFVSVITPNVDHAVRLAREPDLAPYYQGAWLTVNDSRILELIARLDGQQLPACPGADLVEKLFSDGIDPFEPVTIIGGSHDVIEAVRARYGLQAVQWHEPPMGLRKNPAAVTAAAQFVIARPARLVFLCVGSPQQEMIAAEIIRLGGGKGVGLCCGASLDFLAGKVARAPRWMRQARLEWLHRLISEPGRMWKRYLIDGPKIFTIWWRTRQR